MSKEIRPFDKKAVLFLLLIWTVTYPVTVISTLEVLSAIKYAPVSGFYIMACFAVLYAVPVWLYSIPKALKATYQKELVLPVLIGMLAPVMLAAAPHYINIALADAEVYNVSVPIERKSSQIRSPRSSQPYTAFRLHLSFQDVEIAGKKLNGEHIVYVSKETYDQTRTQDLFPLQMKKGPMAVYMLQAENTQNIGR